MGIGCIQQIGDVIVIAKVVTAVTSTTQAAQDSIMKAVAAGLCSSSVGAAAKNMVGTHPSIQDSISKDVSAAIPSCTGGGMTLLVTLVLHQPKLWLLPILQYKVPSQKM